MKTLTPRPQGGAQEPTAGPVAGPSPAPSRPLPERPPLPPGRDLPSLPWLEGELGWLARELRARGCESPTLCSDALQLEGQLRLGQRDPLQRREVLCSSHDGRVLVQVFPYSSDPEEPPDGEWTVLHRHEQHWVNSEREARELAGELVEQEGWLPVPERDEGEQRCAPKEQGP